MNPVNETSQVGSLRVLVIEDDPLLKNLLAMKLTANACTPSYVSDGLTAAATAKEMKPDVILLDLMIPGADGFAVLEQLSQDPETSQIPVMVFSNKSTDADRDRALSLGARSFKVKASTELEDIVNELYALAGRK